MNAVQQIRSKNTMNVIRIIMDLDHFTKSELIEKNGLTLVTVNKIVNNLLEKSTILESGVAESNGGRKASLYEFNPRKCYVAGVSLHTGWFRVCICDMKMTKSTESRILVPEEMDVAAIVALMARSVQEAMAQASVSEEQVAVMGITVQGPVQRETGVVRILPSWRMWQNIPLGSMLQQRFIFPVVVEKDTFAALLYFKYQGMLDVNRSAIYLKISKGVGAGIFMCGDIYRGKGDIAGELGHVSVETDGRKCHCGSFGCLEAYVSDQAIVKSVRKQIKSGASSIVCNGEDLDTMTIQDVIHAAKAEDTLCYNALKSAATYLGIAISNIVKTLNPNDIFLDCEWISAFQSLLEGTCSVSREHVSIFDDLLTVIKPVELSNMGIKGAAALALEYVLEDEENSALLK